MSYLLKALVPMILVPYHNSDAVVYVKQVLSITFTLEWLISKRKLKEETLSAFSPESGIKFMDVTLRKTQFRLSS